MSGVFVTFEGCEGCGKSTQIRRLADSLEAVGIDVLVTREPGGTSVGEHIRGLLLDPDTGPITPRAELLLYEASRAQIVEEVIRPALDAGKVVLCDRFADSSTAYQSYGRGLDLAEVERLNDAATAGLAPDRTIVLDVDAAVGLERATGAGADRLEAEDLAFHERVREGFLEIARRHPERVRVIAAAGTPDEVADRVAAALRDVPSLSRALGG
ncbi:MAG: dTMP kinase [Coriobacteriales bacterium]|nr:dTMP kinase [Coriobacteriales bacterium]